MAPPDAHLTGRLAPSSMLQGRYIIVGLAGKGGMGAVYQAIDTKRTPQRQVAIKEMSQACYLFYCHLHTTAKLAAIVG